MTPLAADLRSMAATDRRVRADRSVAAHAEASRLSRAAAGHRSPVHHPAGPTPGRGDAAQARASASPTGGAIDRAADAAFLAALWEHSAPSRSCAATSTPAGSAGSSGARWCRRRSRFDPASYDGAAAGRRRTGRARAFPEVFDDDLTADGTDVPVVALCRGRGRPARAAPDRRAAGTVRRSRERKHPMQKTIAHRGPRRGRALLAACGETRSTRILTGAAGGAVAGEVIADEPLAGAAAGGLIGAAALSASRAVAAAPPGSLAGLRPHPGRRAAAAMTCHRRRRDSSMTLPEDRSPALLAPASSAAARRGYAEPSASGRRGPKAATGLTDEMTAAGPDGAGAIDDATGTTIRLTRGRQGRRHVREDPDRQPGRDRLPGHQDRPAHGHRDRRRLFRRRRRGAARAHGRRGGAHRPGAGQPVLHRHRAGSSTRSARPAPRRCIRATASSRSAPSSPRRWRRRASPSSARRSAPSRRWATRSPRRSSPPRPASRPCPATWG